MLTSKGKIKIKLYPDTAPKTVTNFLVHAQEGYYDNLIFHRVIDNFMIQ
jgi:cyclophilin family peptidyl-prolyl cis-trans isomerase